MLLTQLNDIYDQTSGKFKVQIGIGRILRNKENGEVKYWRAEHCDSHLLQNQKVVQPMKVNSRSDLKGIAEKAANLATEDYLESARPDTKWELVMPTNVRYYISYTDFVAGYITENLPDYFLNKESVNCLHRDYEKRYQADGNYYQDRLCFFRCLAYHKLKQDNKLMSIGRPLNLLTQQLYYDYNKEVNQHRNQEQVELDQLLELESYFKVNIEVYRCHEDSEKVDHVYKSVDEPGRGEKLYLDLYVGDDENHFSYINNIRAYSHRFECMKCDQDFRTSEHLARHEAVCDGETATKPVFVGGFKKLWPTLFERLQHYGIEVNEEDRYYEHFIVFDCESILASTEEQDDTEKERGRKWPAEHIPVSIAMSASFLPLNPKTGFPSTKCVVRSTPEELVKEFLRLLMKWREPLLMHLKEKYQYVFDILNEKLQESEEILEECNESDKKWEKKWQKGLVELRKDLEKYIQRVPVLGFNSAKYDLNLLRQQLITTYLREYGGEIKKLSKLPRRQLVAGRKARQVLLTTPLLNWYLGHGLVVTKVHQAVEWQFQQCLKQFFMNIASERRQAAQDPSRAAHANKQKLTGTSAYGATLLNKEKFDNVYYVGENECLLKHNDPKFRSSTYIGDGVYEVQMAHKVMKNDIPKQIGLFVLQYAKLRMLQFYYDCFDRYLDRSDFEMVRMDTDSLYFAVSKYNPDQDNNNDDSHPLLPMVKEELVDEFKSRLYDHCQDDWEPDFDIHYFPRQCCTVHNLYDQKTPGLFKLENSGTGIVGLCSKTYCLQMINGQEKMAVKGVNKANLGSVIYKQMLDVLQTGVDKLTVNRGFRMKKQDDNNSKMMTYNENKKAFNYLYSKRCVMEDRIHTKPYCT